MIYSPFKFLDSYTKEDSSIFFGREQETEDLYRKIFENKTLLVYGVSGTGKTSIINCGLANKFNEADWLPITIRRNQNMVESFYAALHKLSPDTKDKGKRDAKAFIKLLQSVYLDHFKPVYLLFDQFEELFIFGDEEEQQAFVDIIAQIKASEVQVKILFIMREEYLANMSAFEEKIPDLLTNRLRIEKMSTAKVKEAITGPCSYAKIGIENEAVEIIIEKLTRQGKTIELTYLQVLLDRLFHKAAQEQKGDNLQFTQSLVASLGEVSDILGDFLEEQIRRFDNPDQVLDVLKSFVSIRGTKRQSTVEEIGNHLRSLNKAQETDTLQSTIQQLVNLRILREKDENDRYELRHDALAMKIYEKVTLVEKELLDVRDFLDNALNNFQKRGRLLSVEDLKYIAPYEEKMFLSIVTSKLIERSKLELTRVKRRRRRIFGSIASSIIIILSLLVIWALSAKTEATRAMKKARVSYLNLEGEKIKDDNPYTAMHLFYEAFKLDSTNRSVKTNMNNLYYSNAIDQILLNFSSLEIYPKDGYNENPVTYDAHNNVLFIQSDNSIGVYNVKTKRFFVKHFRPIHFQGVVSHFAFIPKKQIIAFVPKNRNDRLFILNYACKVIKTIKLSIIDKGSSSNSLTYNEAQNSIILRRNEDITIFSASDFSLSKEFSIQDEKGSYVNFQETYFDQVFPGRINRYSYNGNLMKKFKNENISQDFKRISNGNYIFQKQRWGLTLSFKVFNESINELSELELPSNFNQNKGATVIINNKLKYFFIHNDNQLFKYDVNGKYSEVLNLNGDLLYYYDTLMIYRNESFVYSKKNKKDNLIYTGETLSKIRLVHDSLLLVGSKNILGLNLKGDVKFKNIIPDSIAQIYSLGTLELTDMNMNKNGNVIAVFSQSNSKSVVFIWDSISNIISHRIYYKYIRNCYLTDSSIILVPGSLVTGRFSLSSNDSKDILFASYEGDTILNLETPIINSSGFKGDNLIIGFNDSISTYNIRSNQFKKITNTGWPSNNVGIISATEVFRLQQEKIYVYKNAKLNSIIPIEFGGSVLRMSYLNEMNKFFVYGNSNISLYDQDGILSNNFDLKQDDATLQLSNQTLYYIHNNSVLAKKLKNNLNQELKANYSKLPLDIKLKYQFEENAVDYKIDNADKVELELYLKYLKEEFSQSISNKNRIGVAKKIIKTQLNKIKTWPSVHNVNSLYSTLLLLKRSNLENIDYKFIKTKMDEIQLVLDDTMKYDIAAHLSFYAIDYASLPFYKNLNNLFDFQFQHGMSLFDDLIKKGVLENEMQTAMFWLSKKALRIDGNKYQHIDILNKYLEKWKLFDENIDLIYPILLGQNKKIREAKKFIKNNYRSVISENVLSSSWRNQYSIIAYNDLVERMDNDSLIEFILKVDEKFILSELTDSVKLPLIPHLREITNHLFNKNKYSLSYKAAKLTDRLGVKTSYLPVLMILNDEPEKGLELIRQLKDKTIDGDTYKKRFNYRFNQLGNKVNENKYLQKAKEIVNSQKRITKNNSPIINLMPQ